MTKSNLFLFLLLIVFFTLKFVQGQSETSIRPKYLGVLTNSHCEKDGKIFKWKADLRRIDAPFESGLKFIDYTIDFSNATLTFGDEIVAFTHKEAMEWGMFFALNCRQHDMIDNYALESSLWAIEKQGIPLKPGEPHPEGPMPKMENPHKRPTQGKSNVELE